MHWIYMVKLVYKFFPDAYEKESKVKYRYTAKIEVGYSSIHPYYIDRFCFKTVTKSNKKDTLKSDCVVQGLKLFRDLKFFKAH